MHHKQIVFCEDSYLSLKIKLSDEGIDIPDQDLLELLIKRGNSIGMTRDQMLLDLENYATSIETRRVNYLSQSLRNHELWFTDKNTHFQYSDVRVGTKDTLNKRTKLSLM